jgi:hypothetical protein
MAIYITTNIHGTLVSEIMKKIDKGEIKTWKYDSKKRFTHLGEIEGEKTHWEGMAWFVSSNEDDDSVTFELKDIDKSEDGVEAVYHGRFTQMLLYHFPDKIEAITVP